MAMFNENVKSVKRFEEGMVVIREAVDRIIGIAEETNNQSFSSEDYMRYYTIIYELSVPNPLGEYSRELYDYYKKIFEEYITSKVLPSLSGKRDQDLLQELVRRWSIHKTITHWLFRFFHYLERYYIIRRKLPSLQQTSYRTFNNLVYAEIFGAVRDAVTAMINRERDQEQIDQAFMKSILAINAEIGLGSAEQQKQNLEEEQQEQDYEEERNEQDLEEAILKDTAAFYSQKASSWIQNKSYDEYMLLVNRFLAHEKDTVSSYLQAKNQNKLLEAVAHELFNAQANELERKKQVHEFSLADKQQVN